MPDRPPVAIEPPHQLSLRQLKAYDIYAYWSAKGARLVHCIGPSAYRLGVWLEGQPDVRAYSERPFGMSNSKRIADFIAIHGTEQRRVVHAYARAKVSAETRSAWDAQVKEQGAELQWFDERNDAALRGRIDALVRMLPYVAQHSQHGSRSTELEIKTALEQRPHTIGQLDEAIQVQPLAARAALFTMYFAGKVDLDLTRDLTLDSTARLAR